MKDKTENHYPQYNQKGEVVGMKARVANSKRFNDGSIMPPKLKKVLYEMFAGD